MLSAMQLLSKLLPTAKKANARLTATSREAQYPLEEAPHPSREAQHPVLRVLRRVPSARPASRPGRHVTSRPWTSLRLALTLSFVLTLLPSDLFAGPKLAIFGLHTSDVSPEQAQKVYEALENSMRQSSVFTLLSDEAIVQNFAPRSAEIQEALFLLPGRALLQEARVYAEQVQFDKAIERLEQAESFFIFYSEHLTSNQELIEIQLSLAQLYAGRGDQEAMEDRLRRLTLLAPDRALDPLRASPQMLEAHQRIKAEARQNTADLELVSQPAGAKVYINGVLRGTTPSQISGLPQGRYFVSMRHDNGGRFFQEVLLSRTGVTQVGGTLGPSSLYSASRPLPPPAVGEARLYQAYQILGAKAGVNFVLLGHLKRDGLEVQLLDVSDGQKGPLYQAPVSPDLSNLSSSLRNLQLQVETLVNPSGRLLRTTTYPLTTDPSNNAMLKRFIFPSEGAAGITENSSSKPLARSTRFYEQRWFWVVAGGVVLGAAGGTTAAVMASQQEGSGVGQVRFEFK